MKRFGFVLTAALVLLAAACQSPTQSGHKAAAKSGYVKGVITAKGSIWVNGVEYETTGAAVVVDGVTVTDAALKVGMDVAFNVVDGVATAVDYESEVKGFLDATPVGNSFAVFGLTVDVGMTTIYEGSGVTGVASLLANDFVEVSGSVDPATGHLIATRVERKTGEDAKVKGIVSALSGNSFTLTTESGVAFSIVASSGTLGAAVVDGAQVRVEFTNTDFNAATAPDTISVAADKIEVKTSDVHEVEGGDAEVEGVVDGYILTGSTMSFTVDGQAVSADTSLTTAVIADGVRVEVKGTISSGTLVASELEFKPSDDDLGEGDGAVTGISLVAQTITINDASNGGAPLTLTVDTSTIFDDDAWQGTSPLSVVNTEFGAAGAGTYLVEVKYYQDPVETTVYHLVKIELQ